MTGSSKCPKCGIEVVIPVKSWVLEPRKGGSAFRIEYYECPKCLRKWRKVVKLR